MIGIPNIDGNTIALVKFGRYGILDYCSKVMWTHHGNEPTIVYDSQMGNAMLSKNCYYTSSDYAFGTNTTLEAWCWIQNNSSDRCALAQIKCDNARGINISAMPGRAHIWCEGRDTDPVVSNGWHHVAITMAADGTTNRFFDGKLVGSMKSAYAIQNHGVLQIGANGDGAGNDSVSRIAFIRFSSCVRYTGNFDPRVVWSNSPGDSYLTYRKNGKKDYVPTYTVEDWNIGWSRHNLFTWKNAPEYYCYFPCIGNANDAVGRVWNVQNVQVINDGRFDFAGGYRALRFDWSKGNSYIVNTNIDLGQSFYADWYFRIPDQKKSKVDIAGFRTCNFDVRYESGQYRAYFYTNSENANKKSAYIVIQPNQWTHACFFYLHGTTFAAAVNGNWIISQYNGMTPQNDTWCWWGGWVDNRPNIVVNSKTKPIVDLCNMRIVKLTGTSLLPYLDSLYHQFFAPQLPISIKRVNGRIVVNTRIQLMQDIIDSPLRFRVDGGIYGIDPCLDPTSFHPENKIMHLTNVNGSLRDLTGKTGWSTHNITLNNWGNGMNGIQFNHSANNYGGMLCNSSVLALQDRDFTILIDFMFLGRNAFKATSEYDSEWYNCHELFAAPTGGFVVRVRDNMRSVLFGVVSNNNMYGIEARIPFEIPLKADQRIIVQRKNSRYDLWVAGVHVVSGVTKYAKITNVNSYRVGTSSANNLPGAINGWIRNIAIWDKAIFTDGGTIKYNPSIGGDYEEEIWTMSDNSTKQGDAFSHCRVGGVNNDGTFLTLL